MSLFPPCNLHYSIVLASLVKLRRMQTYANATSLTRGARAQVENIVNRAGVVGEGCVLAHHAAIPPALRSSNLLARTLPWGVTPFAAVPLHMRGCHAFFKSLRRGCLIGARLSCLRCRQSCQSGRGC